MGIRDQLLTGKLFSKPNKILERIEKYWNNYHYSDKAYRSKSTQRQERHVKSTKARQHRQEIRKYR